MLFRGRKSPKPERQSFIYDLYLVRAGTIGNDYGFDTLSWSGAAEMTHIAETIRASHVDTNVAVYWEAGGYDERYRVSASIIAYSFSREEVPLAQKEFFGFSLQQSPRSTFVAELNTRFRLQAEARGITTSVIVASEPRISTILGRKVREGSAHHLRAESRHRTYTPKFAYVGELTS